MVEISLVPFKFEYFPLLIEMHTAQKYLGTSYLTMKTLPKIGYIALMNKQPIAAGFLRRLEPCYAQIDTLVSNPYFGSQARHEGIQKVVDALLMDAKALKLEGIVALTSDSGVLKRAESLGFHIIDQKVIGLKID